jgi:glutathione S-transferase
MIKLYDSAFSPFARKVRMVLDHKGLDHETIDGLLKSNHGALAAVNGRIEVPTLMDGDIVVVNSPDIVAYLEHRYPQMPVYPQEPAARVHARAWERLSDTFVDPIFVDVSYWKWAERPDHMPQGLLEAARADLRNVSTRTSPAPRRWRSNFQRRRIRILHAGSSGCAPCRSAPPICGGPATMWSI